MSDNLRFVGVKFNKDIFEQIEIIAKKEGLSISDVVRDLVNKGLSERVLEENTELIAQIVRQQMEIVIKPHIERLAALSSKGGHMAATAAFLNVQALMDLVPVERRKNVKEMYDNARKKSVEYMRTKTTDWEYLNND